MRLFFFGKREQLVEANPSHNRVHFKDFGKLLYCFVATGGHEPATMETPGFNQQRDESCSYQLLWKEDSSNCLVRLELPPAPGISVFVDGSQVRNIAAEYLREFSRGRVAEQPTL